MERHVKERLIGAAVLMAAAVILIPEMLSGPDRKTTAPDAHAKTDAALKTYTIDLQQQTKPATETVIEDRAPPPEEAPPVGDAAAPPPDDDPPQAIPESSATAASTSTLAAQAAKSGESPAVTTQEPPQTRASPSTAIRQPPASPTPSAAARSGRWAVQLGSFSREETARRLADEMGRAGHDAFVMPVRSGAATLYRVRIGPMSDRASAEATLSALKAKSPGAAVVAHP